MGKLNAAERRKLNVSKYGGMYSKIEFNDSVCFYCGCHASTVDHVPPIDYVATMGSERVLGMRMVLVPSCEECNFTLGSKWPLHVDMRAAYLAGKYIDKYIDVISSPKWGDELFELEGGLRQYVQSKQDVRLLSKRRLDMLMNICLRMPIIEAVTPQSLSYEDTDVSVEATKSQRLAYIDMVRRKNAEAMIAGSLIEDDDCETDEIAIAAIASEIRSLENRLRVDTNAMKAARRNKMPYRTLPSSERKVVLSRLGYLRRALTAITDQQSTTPLTI